MNAKKEDVRFIQLYGHSLESGEQGLLVMMGSRGHGLVPQSQITGDDLAWRQCLLGQLNRIY